MNEVFFFSVIARERMELESNEKTGTFISARQSPKWIKAIEQPNKWMRTQEKKINFKEPSIRAKQSTIKLGNRPRTSKIIPMPLQSRSVANKKDVKTIPTTVVQSSPVLDYRKMVDTLHYGAVAEKCILLEALKWVCEEIDSKFLLKIRKDFHFHLQRLTKSKDIAPNETIKQFIANDLLQLKTNNLLTKLLWPLDRSENSFVQQNCVASLLNALVSYKEGRKYFDGISMLKTLTTNTLGNSLIEKNTLDNLIAVMAKLSIAAYHRQDFDKSGKRFNSSKCKQQQQQKSSSLFSRR